MGSTLVIHWVFTWLAIGLIVLRLALRKLRGLQFTLGDRLAMGAILCVIVRLVLVHVILIWGTNNVPHSFRQTHIFTDEDIRHREIASKFVLANRVFYNSYLWLQKLVLLDTYRKLLTQLRWEKATMASYLFIFGATYITVQIVTFTECDPFDHYWIVLPDPGKCCQAQLQLIVLGVLNIFTDVMLIALPIPILVLVKRSIIEKLQLASLFAVGIFIVAITIVRLPLNAENATAQVSRTTWASIELLAASLVANAPVIYGFLKGHWERSRNASSGTRSFREPRLFHPTRSTKEPDYELRHIRHEKKRSILTPEEPKRVYTTIDEASI